MKKLLIPAVTLSLLAPGVAFAKKKNKGPDYDNSVTIAPVMLTWPSVQLEYERRLGNKIGVAGFGSFGRFQPRALTSLVEGMMGDSVELRSSASLGARGNFYFKDFDRSWFLGLTARWGMVNVEYSETSEEQGVEIESKVESRISNVMAGPHIGYKIAFKPGITLAFNVGCGYGSYSVKSTASAEGGGQSASQDLNDVDGPGLVPFGVFQAGWSF